MSETSKESKESRVGNKLFHIDCEENQSVARCVIVIEDHGDTLVCEGYDRRGRYYMNSYEGELGVFFFEKEQDAIINHLDEEGVLNMLVGLSNTGYVNLLAALGEIRIDRMDEKKKEKCFQALLGDILSENGISIKDSGGK